MKTLSIRKFMVIGMISVVMFPWFVFIFIHFNNINFKKDPQQTQEKTNEFITMIITDSAKWGNPDWQSNLRKRLNSAKMDAVILSPSNQEIFQSGSWHKNPWIASQQVIVSNNNQIIGTVKLYTKWQNDIVAGLSALSALIIAILFVGFQMRRSVVKPLEAMSKAARRIAEGDFDIDLPVSHVMEIAEVRAGFKVMVEGLRESFQKQAQLEEERRFFIGAIAHDLRTPLFALRGYLDGLEQGIASSPEKMAKYVAVCKEKSEQLDRLVSDLFTFTKLEYMEQMPHLQKVDLANVLQKSIDGLKALAEDKNISIALVSHPYILGIMADPHLLERAMNNLLDNALRHTPIGGKIEVTGYCEQGKTFVQVKDTGPGFSPEDLRHIFELLYRGEASRNRATGGAGLGLTIAKRIFKAHNGDLIAANDPGGGAVLTGWIPG